ncbi:NUDIX hydrolase [candidate division KSB1 bacterium]
MNAQDNLFEKVLKRDSLYRGKYMDLERFHIKLPDGRTGTREIVRVKNAVAVLPVDDNNVTHILRQHRPAIGKTILEIPAGLIDEGENAAQAAVRECEEETGYKPRKLTELLTYAHAEGYSTGFITLFLATQLEHSNRFNPDETEFFEQAELPFDTLYGKVRAGEFIDSKTILTVLLSKELIDKP